MTKFETKAIRADMKADRDSWSFAGYASVFGVLDRSGDRVAPGAFKRTIVERGGQKLIKVMIDHATPIGVPVEIREDERGLWTENQVVRTQQGADFLAAIDLGLYSHMSIGFTTVQSASAEDGSRLIADVDLYEVSAVLWPANDYATIARKGGDILTSHLDAMLAILREQDASRDALERLSAQVSELSHRLELRGYKRPDSIEELASADLTERHARALGHAVKDLRRMVAALRKE